MTRIFGVSRRGVVAAGVSAFGMAMVELPLKAGAAEIALTDDDSRSDLALYDVENYGPPGTLAVTGAFRFPADADDGVYGIDISHHNKVVPWRSLAEAGVRFVYVKCSQSDNARDPQFDSHWVAASALKSIPRGGYHFVTAGVSGISQGKFFADRLKKVGLAKGDLQPVIDLEWDFLGKDFTRTKIGTRMEKGKIVNIYKDYWSDMSAADIVATITGAVMTIRKELAPLTVQPIIYTNASWWNERLAGTVIANCKIWISDYREASYKNKVPKSVPHQPYNLWQFTEKGAIKTSDGKKYGVDCNKIVFGSLNDLLIA